MPSPGPRARRPALQGCSRPVVRTAISERPLVEAMRDMRGQDHCGSLVLGRVRAVPYVCVAVQTGRSRLAEHRRPEGAAHLSREPPLGFRGREDPLLRPAIRVTAREIGVRRVTMAHAAANPNVTRRTSGSQGTLAGSHRVATTDNAVSRLAELTATPSASLRNS